MNDFHPTDDLDWQAFAYWADELSPADRLEFEQRLADEQPAREALARAVELSQAVVAAEALVAPSSREATTRRSRRTLGWVAAIAASVLAMVAGFSLGRRDNQSPWPTIRSAKSQAASAELARAWSETRSEWPELSTWQPSASTDEPDDHDDWSPDALPSDWEATTVETPSWMTAAVVGQQSAGQQADEPNAPDDAPPAESRPEPTGTES